MCSFSASAPYEVQELLIENRIWFSDVAALDDVFEGRPILQRDNVEPTYSK